MLITGIIAIICILEGIKLIQTFREVESLKHEVTTLERLYIKHDRTISKIDKRVNDILE